MIQFFVDIYNFFSKRKTALYLSLFMCIGIMSYFTLQLKFEENISNFFPDTNANEANLNEVFNNLRVKDKIVILFSAKETDEATDQEDLIGCATQFYDSLTHKVGSDLINNIVFKVDHDIKQDVQNFVYNHLPLFLTEEDYQRMDSLLMDGKIASIMQKNRSNLLSPAGGVLQEYVMRDPLGIGGNALKKLQDFQLETGVEPSGDYLYGNDGNTLILLISPTYGMENTGENDKLVTAIEQEINSLAQEHSNIDVSYYGGPSVGVYNARQIKYDSILTINIALLIIVVFTLLAFKEKKTIPLLIAPVLFGGLFSLFMISLIKGSISAIAVGSGSIILGVALSYSIHMVVHQGYVKNIEQLIRELVYPLTIGSFTTIGAFLGLLFTSSDLLRDFGLFASLALVGTILFSLIYLPHFLKGAVHEKKGKLMNFIERLNAYKFHENKWLIGAIILLFVVCIFTSQRVGFDADMMSLNYEPKHIKDAEQKLMSIVESNKKTILFVSVGKDATEAALHYKETNRKLQDFKDRGLVQDFASADYFLVSPRDQEDRLSKWTSYWTQERKQQIKDRIEEEGAKVNFKANAFNQFYSWLDSDFEQQKKSYSNNYLASNKMLEEWQNASPDMMMFISHVQLEDTNKEEVYSHFSDTNQVVVFDRAYLTSKWMSVINDDFYLILGIASFLIFITLLISYGRIELAFISFLPMFISWIIIVGVMGMLDMNFNIVTIILSTFIFGIGDDYSIFVMDGLLSKYRTNKTVLNSHKTAIFFSVFTVIVGMGALIFAQHPALYSISIMSILGMLVVVLVSYTIPPVVFRLLIAQPTEKGYPPYTLFSILITSWCFVLFVVGCFVLHIIMLSLYLVPMSLKKKQALICYLIMLSCKFLCFAAFNIKKKKINISAKIFDKPSILIANHQSFLDILFLLSLHSKLVMVTNHWVWKSPFFGLFIRYAGFLYIGEGCENAGDKMQQRIDDGYSVIIFPEGTRTSDGVIKRFHKGAFFFAQEYKADITPILLYGTGMLISKLQPYDVKTGVIVAKALPRISYADTSFGKTYRERTKNIAHYFKEEYNSLCQEYSNSGVNPYFYNHLIKSYIYKGPVEEWYVRIKVKMEKSYQFFDSLILSNASITNIGCGYGTLDYMLTMLSPNRQILGIDYDEDKIDVANASFLKKDNINFIYANALEYDLPQSDVVILCDILHYMSLNDQQLLIEKCANSLNQDGFLIVRDANTDKKKGQKLTSLSELFSTRILRFNKIKQDLCFISAEQMYTLANECGMSVESFDNDSYTSNTIFLMRKTT